MLVHIVKNVSFMGSHFTIISSLYICYQPLDVLSVESFKEGINFSQKHNYNMAKMMVFIAEINYMFRPISAIL